MQNNLVNNSDSVTRKSKQEIPCTDKTVQYLKPKSKGKTYCFKGLEGFGIRVSPKGTKT